MRLRFLATGTGRSGTVFMAKVLTHLGLPCGHESFFTTDDAAVVQARCQGQVEPVLSHRSQAASTQQWVDVRSLVADASYMAVPYLSLVPDVPVIHVVRHPLLVISSFVKDLGYFRRDPTNPYNSEGHEDWIYQHTPDLEYWTDPVDAAAAHYLTWNETIEAVAGSRPYVRVRTGERLPDAFFQMLDTPRPAAVYSRRVNSLRRKRRIDHKLSDLHPELQAAVIDLCGRYGFWLPDCDP